MAARLDAHNTFLLPDELQFVERMEKIARECKELIAQAMQDQARGIDKIVLTPAAYAEFADLARVLAEGWAQEVRNESTRNLLRSVASNWHHRRGRPKKGEQTGLLGIPVPVEKPKKGYAGRPPLWARSVKESS